MEIQYSAPETAAFGSGALPDRTTADVGPVVLTCQLTPMVPGAVVDHPNLRTPSVGRVATTSLVPTALMEGSFAGSPAITIERVVAARAPTTETADNM